MLEFSLRIIVLVFDRMDDEGRPIFRQDPIDYEYYNEAMIDSEDFGCDSGS